MTAIFQNIFDIAISIGLLISVINSYRLQTRVEDLESEVNSLKYRK
jgi:lipoprotein signal peptidase